MDPNDPVGRLFFAAAMPDEARHALAAHLAGALGGKPVPGSPVPPANWHFTLRFLGKTTRLQYEKVVAAVDGSELGETFDLVLGNLGAFPRPARATVLWVGLQRGEEELARLAAVTEEAAQASGFSAEERPFHAHLTLSRIRPHQDVGPVLERVPPPPVRWRVGEVVLYQSHLGGGKPARYEPLERFPLE